MRKLCTYKVIFLLGVFFYKNALSQEFNIKQNDKSSIYLEFNLDTTNLKNIIKKKGLIDFSKLYYCSNQYKKPILPLFNFTLELNDSSLAVNIQSIQSKQLKIDSIRKGEKFKKRGINSSISAENNFDLIKISDPYISRDFLGQNIQISPFEFDSIRNILICNYKIKIKIYCEKRLNSIFFESNNLNRLNFDEKNFYSLKKTNKNLKSLNPSTSELLIVFRDTNNDNARLLANWKNQKGIKTSLLKLTNHETAINIKNEINKLYSNNPNLKYVLLLGNHSEIPAYNYGLIDGDNYYSDSYFGQLTNDLYPELFIGRITGNSKEINSIIKKSIFYEKENFEGNWMIKSIGIGSNEGLGDGDNGEADWQHLRVIKNKLINNGYSNVYEFYDGDHGEDDLVGSPDKTEILKALNDGVSIVNYTGHGDDNVFVTSQLSSKDLTNLSNTNKNPFIVSVACDNGKFINNEGTLAEAFLKCKDENTFTGSIAFCGSSILMDWAPPMLTQDEIINTIINKDSIYSGYSIGELFYGSQIKMLNKYNTLGNGVMQTWILFGDPTIDLKTKIPQNIEISYNYLNETNELLITSNTDKVLLGISENNNFLNSYILKKGLNKIILDSLNQTILLTFTKPNHKTLQYTLTKTNLVKSKYINNVNVFPNPISISDNQFFINGLNVFDSIYLTDLLGKEQELNFHVENNNIIVKFENLKNGLYFLKIKKSNNSEIIKRLIVN